MRRRRALRAALVSVLVAVSVAACRQSWDTSTKPIRDEELEAAFFSGLNSDEIPDVAEPTRLRPCCVFANDVGVSVGAITVPGYEVRNVLAVEDLGRHTYDNGAITVQRRSEGQGILTDEKSGILYTCRGGFIDVAHVRDNADRTFFLAAQLSRKLATGGAIELSDEGGHRRVVLRPVAASLVQTYGMRELVTSLAEWIDFELSIWHEIATWYRWSATSFSEQPSAFSPEDLYSNLLGLKIGAEIVRRHAAASEEQYNRAVTAMLAAALARLGPLPADASRFAFEYVDGIWWDSNRQIPENSLVRHRNFALGPNIYPWKLVDAASSSALLAKSAEYSQTCSGDWTALGLGVRQALGETPMSALATVEIRPDPVLIENGFRPPHGEGSVVTQQDIPAIVQTIEKACDAELGAGCGLAIARPGEKSRVGAD